jgi:hypothetical protein
VSCLLVYCSSPSTSLLQTVMLEYQFGALDDKRGKFKEAISNLQ